MVRCEQEERFKSSRVILKEGAHVIGGVAEGGKVWLDVARLFRAVELSTVLALLRVPEIRSMSNMGS